MSAPALWRVTLVVPAGSVALFEEALARHCQVVWHRPNDRADDRLDGLTGDPFEPALNVSLALAAAAAGIAPPAVMIEPVPPRDWLAENRETFAPFRLGRFFIHQDDDTATPPPATVPIAIDAGLAFGTGRHASTAGCLAAFETLSGVLPSGAVLDLGCGSGILAIAAARVLRRSVVAADIDPMAVRIAAENAAHNGVGACVRAVTADGCAHPLIRARAPYALIFANILARPLRQLARAIVAHTAEGGSIVLAGFVVGDAASVLARYRALGCRLERTIVSAGWSTLVLRRSGRNHKRGNSSTKLQGRWRESS